jgi:hypothetical protein
MYAAISNSHTNDNAYVNADSLLSLGDILRRWRTFRLLTRDSGIFIAGFIVSCDFSSPRASWFLATGVAAAALATRFPIALATSRFKVRVTRSDLGFPVRSCAVQFSRVNQVGEGAVTCDT